MRVSRRGFLGGLAGFAAAPMIGTPAGARPRVIDGVTAGDVTADGAVIWARADRAARMVVDWSTSDSFRDASRKAGLYVTGRTGYTGQVILDGLPQGRDIFYRVRFEAPDGHAIGESVTGHLRTPGPDRDVTFVFGGDQCGAGWGINPEWGGLRLFEAMEKTAPDFLVHLGDRIYADRPMNESVILGEDRRWINIVTPAKKYVAETLDQFRGNYSYNFIDRHYRRFAANVPMIATWDDHEVTDNWWPGQTLSRRIMQRKGYLISAVDLLARRGRQAFFDFTPMRRRADDPDRIFRRVSYGPLVDVFVLDARSYRSPNGRNRQTASGRDASLLGRTQVEWLKRALARSRAVWKVVGNPLPIAHVHKAERPRYDKWANGDPGQPLGREMEMADILSFIKHQGIANVVWLAADVHYSAANHFDPGRAAFKDFNPFWEFVSGPFHTRPGRVRHLDATFGPEQLFRTPVSPDANPPPSAGYQYFGHARIDAKTAAMTVSLRDLSGRPLYEKTLAAER